MAINSTSFIKTPQAGDDSWSWLEDQLSGGQTLVLDVLANDLGGNAKTLYSVDNGDVLADLLTRDPGLTTAWESSAGGNLVRINAGKIEFKLSATNDLDGLALGQGYNDSFRYAIQMGNGTLSWATVTLNVAGQNDGPQAVADTASAGENEALVIDVLANDNDEDQGHVFTLLSVQAPAGRGSASVVEGRVAFDPGTDFDHLAEGTSTTVELTYWMRDEHGAQSSATLVVTVNGTNDAPVAVADMGSGGENDVVTVDALANDTDLDDGAVLSLVNASTVAGQGSASIVGGQVAFDPGTDFDSLNVGATAVVEVAYTVRDAQGAESSSVVTVTLQGTNDAADITGIASATAAETDALLMLSGLLDAYDVDDAEGFQASSATGTYGEFSIAASGAWSFTANSAFDELNVGGSVSESFTVLSVDGTSASVSVQINGTNDAAVITGTASAIANETDEALVLEGTLTAMDVDDAEGFQASSETGTYGDFSILESGDWSFTANSAFDELNVGDSVSESFTVLSVDGTSASVSVQINGTNDAAEITGTASAIANETNEALVLDGTLTAIDVDNADGFQASSETGTYGDFSMLESGAWSFTANSAFDELNVGGSVSESFTVLSVDGTSASVSVQINGTNDSAEITGTASAVANETNEALVLEGTLTAIDVDDAEGFQASSETGTYGDFSIGGSGAWIFTANSAFDGLNAGDSVAESFAVQSVDGTAASVSVQINGTNDAAAITGTSSATAAETNARLALSGVLAAIDVDDDEGFQPDTIQGTHGSFSIDASGQWNFLADTALDALNVGNTATDSFTVRSVDGTQATVAITIQGTNDAAQITNVPANATVQEDGTLTVSGDLGVVDPDNSLAFQAVAPADLQKTYGSFAFDAATGQWSYTLANSSAAVQALNTGDTRTDSLVVKSLDGTAVATLQVTIEGANDLMAYVVPSRPVTTNTITGTNQGETLNGTAANDLILGEQGQDSLNGAGGNDVLMGGQAADTLTGGPGNDYLTGDQANDIFRFTSVADATDVITDFGGGDRIVFSGAITGGGAALSLIRVDTNANGSADATLLQVDSNGAAAGGTLTDMAVVLGTTTLSMSDIDWIL